MADLRPFTERSHAPLPSLREFLSVRPILCDVTVQDHAVVPITIVPPAASAARPHGRAGSRKAKRPVFPASRVR